MKTIRIISYSVLLSFLLFSNNNYAQSFNDEKTSLINYLKRMYNLSPFEGAKLIEGDQNSYYVAAISLGYNTDSLEINKALAEIKAEEAAKITFAEPCVKFELLSLITDGKKKSTYLFSFYPLSDFIKSTYKKQPFNGAKIIAAPKINYFVSVIALDSQKYESESMMDKVASIKAKQQANVFFNGSVINSDMIIKIDGVSGSILSKEVISEQSIGFVEGLELLNKYHFNQNKVYIFYRKL